MANLCRHDPHVVSGNRFGMIVDARCPDKTTIEGIGERPQVDAVCFVIGDQETPSVVIPPMSPAVPMLHGIMPSQPL